MITNVRIGNDIKLIWQILKGGQSVDLTGATDVKVSVFQGGNSSCGNVYIDTFKITDAVNGILSVEIPKEVITEVGYMWTVLEYTLHDDDMIDGDRKVTVDNVPVRIVSLTAEASQVYEFNVSSDILAGFQGLSAYEVWLKDNPDKTKEEYYNWLQKPATDAVVLIEDKIEELDTAIQNEADRVEAENTRSQNEETRQSNETDRVENETLRNSAETTRLENEASRINAENLRDANETDRQSEETARQTAEGLRVIAETDRNNAEGLRSTAETNRSTAEGLRVEAEEQRVLAEELRQTNTATAISNAENATENANTAAQNANDAREAIQSDLALKANHGYESNPKTLKEVDDDLAQLAVEQNKKTDGAWAINKDDWASVADAVIDVRIEIDTTVKDISIENVRTDGENILLTVKYSYWNGAAFLSTSYGFNHELGDDSINTAEWSIGNIKSIRVTYVKSRLKTARNYTEIQVKDANIVLTPIPRIVQSIGNLHLTVKNDVILKVESLTSHMPETFVITRLRNSESKYFYVVAEIDGVEYTYSGRTELYTGITPVTLSSFIVYVNADSVARNNEPLAIEINPLEIQQSIEAVEGMAEIIPAGENIIKELTESSVDDESLWGQGFLYPGGTISGGNWVYSKKYYYVPKGTVTFRTRVEGNANIIGINKLGEIKLALNTYYNTVDITEDLYVKISHPKSEPTSVLEVYSNTPLTAKKEPINIVRGGLNAPVSSDGVISFMKDIFKESIQKPKLPYPIVTFIMDDGHERDEWVISILDSKGVKGTFAIPTRNLVTPQPNKLTPERIIELYRDGHDIASHTYSEVNAGNVTIEEYELEMIKSKLFMMQCGIESNMHVPVQGVASAAVQNVIRKYYECSFVSNNNAPANIPPINNNIMTRRSFDAEEKNVSTLQRSKDFVDGALISREWLIFTTHPAYTEYTLPDGQMRRDEFAELIDYIKLQGIPILTAKRAYQYYKNIFEFKRPNSTEYAIIGMDGSE